MRTMSATTRGRCLSVASMTSSDTGVPELSGAPLFIVDALAESEELLVDGSEGRHAVEVLRLGPGEPVRVGDGRGTVAEGEVLSAGSAGLRVAVRSRFEVPAPDPEFVLVQALPKGDRGPLAVDLATEVPYEPVTRLLGRLSGIPLRSERMHTFTHQVAEELTVLAVAREEIARRVAQVAPGRLCCPVLVLGIDGANIPSRPERARAPPGASAPPSAIATGTATRPAS